MLDRKYTYADDEICAFDIIFMVAHSALTIRVLRRRGHRSWRWLVALLVASTIQNAGALDENHL